MSSQNSVERLQMYRKAIPFYEWFPLNEEDLKREFGVVDPLHSEPCTSCHGTGDCECSCGDIHDCEACEGEGEVGDAILFQEYAREQYNTRVAEDQKKIKRYLEEVCR